jgi:hypothetical protein
MFDINLVKPAADSNPVTTPISTMRMLWRTTICKMETRGDRNAKGEDAIGF